MLNTNTNFDIYNNLSKRPVIVIQFDSIVTYFCTGTFSGITSSYKKYIKNVKYDFPKIDLLKPKARLPKYEITIAEDSNLTLLNLMNSNSMAGRKVTIKLGFQEITITDFIDLPYGFVEKIEVNSEDKEYTFTIQSKLFLFRKPLFRDMGKTYLTADVAVADVVINVGATADFQPADNPAWGLGGGLADGTFILADDELMHYTAKAANTFTVTRGINSHAVKHSQGTDIYEVISISGRGNNFEVLMQILTTTTAGTNGDWDLGLSNWGLGIDVDEFDINQIRNEICVYGKYHSAGIVQNLYILPQKDKLEDGLKFFEEVILNYMKCNFIITENGKIGIKTIDIWGEKEGRYSISENEIIGIPEIESEEKNVTHIQFKGWQNPMKSGYEDIDEMVCDELDAEFGESDPLVYNDYSGGQTYKTGEEREKESALIFGLFGNPATKIDMDMFLTGLLLQVGDIVNINHSKLLHLRNNQLGWTDQACMIIGINFDFDSKNCKTALNLITNLWQEIVDIQDIHVFEQNDMDDYVLTEDVDHAENNLQAADAYLDQTDYDAMHIMVRFEIEQPGSGGGSDHEYITVHINAQNPVNTDMHTKLEKHIYYDETSDKTVYIDMYIWNITGADPFASGTPLRTKIDWTAHSGANAPSSVKVNLIKFWDYKGTMTETDIK